MSNQLQEIVKPLIEWYSMHQRKLPWREDKNPYHVWVSEIMLQQTRIEAVKNYYTRFMAELPTIESLSQISEEKLLKLWEGLGYYSRARNLKKAAEIIMQQYNGVMPNHYEELLKLPGIGEYTAGAIASICYDEKVPAIDGNVLRVVARLIGSKKNVLLPETKKEVTKMVQDILPKQAGNFNVAIMELGEIVCLPNGAPACENCPLCKSCVAYRENLTQEIPVRIKNLKRKKEEKTVFIFITKDNKIAIEKRTQKGLLSGMYQLPNCQEYWSEKEITPILTGWNLNASEIYFMKKEKHVFTHIDWEMQGYYIQVKEENNQFEWVSLQELAEHYPLPTAFQKFIPAVSLCIQ